MIDYIVHKKVVNADEQKIRSEQLALKRKREKYPELFMGFGEEIVVNPTRESEDLSPANTFYFATGGERRHRP